MKLVTTIRLFPDDPSELLDMMEQFNKACNALSQRAFEDRLFTWLPLQQATYHWLRDEFGLTGEQSVTAIRKVAYAYSDKSARNKPAKFRLRGGVPLYRHSYKKGNVVRFYGLYVPFVAREDIYISGKCQAKLTYQNGKFIIYQAYEVESEEEYQPEDWLGCDLGIVNLLADSDEEMYSGADIDDNCRKYVRRRRNLQRNGSRSAVRKMKKLSGKQARYQRDINHQISKRVVAKAKDTRRGIALEDLKGIQKGITVRKAQRARHHNWGFHQLRSFIEYKAELVGVPVMAVDPRNTSRECPECGHIDKKNRPNQATFKCVSCSFAGHADTVAARNIRARALGNVPTVTV